MGTVRKYDMPKFAAFIVDIRNMPNYSEAVPNGAESVSAKRVSLDGNGYPICWSHGAMNGVSQDRRLWRCLTCHEGCYVTKFADAPIAQGAAMTDEMAKVSVI